MLPQQQSHKLVQTITNKKIQTKIKNKSKKQNKTKQNKTSCNNVLTLIVIMF